MIEIVFGESACSLEIWPETYGKGKIEEVLFQYL